jgi:hypothetical protein
VLLTDLRRIEASAFAESGGFSDTDMASDQATFGESPWDSTVQANAAVLPSIDPPIRDPASGSARTDQHTAFFPAPGGFVAFGGHGSFDILNLPETSAGGGTIHNVVDITFHLDAAESFSLSGTMPVYQSTTTVLLTRVGGSPIFSHTQGGGYSTFGILEPGDYRLLNQIDASAGDPGLFGEFFVGLELEVVPEPLGTVYLAGVAAVAPLIWMRRARVWQ